MDTTDTALLGEEEFCILCKVGTEPASSAVLLSYLLVTFFIFEQIHPHHLS